MTALLAIETSTSACSVALRWVAADRQRRDVARHSSTARTHSATLLALIEQLLADAAIERGELSAVAISSGPGSFTGLRIGLAVAQGIALGLAIPLLAIDSLAVLAETARGQLADGSRLMAISDARMGQYNAASYQLAGAELTVLAPPALLDADALTEQLAAHSIGTVVGELGGGVADQLALPDGAVELSELLPRAGAMLDTAERLWRAGSWPALEQVELIYLRGSEAWQRHQPIVPVESAQ